MLDKLLLNMSSSENKDFIIIMLNYNLSYPTHFTHA